jgi:uncharacterized protein YraI
MEALSSLANTPVPTLLVVAGVFFLFVALGGQFGAQIVTEKVNPKNALIAGLLFVATGVALFSITGQGKREEGRSIHSRPDTSIEGPENPSAKPAPLIGTTVCSRSTSRIPTGFCDQIDGNYIVVNVRSDDIDHGLQVRERPNLGGVAIGVLPQNGINVKVGECRDTDGSAWCYVECSGKTNIAGWARERYLALRSSSIYMISAEKGDIGVKMRNGPSEICSVTDSIPPSARDIVLHICEKSSDDSDIWCLVTYNKHSGWVVKSKIERQK